MKVNIINRSKNKLPFTATVGSAGMDLMADIDIPMDIAPMQRIAIPTGLYMAIPYGYEGQVRSRSGLAYKYGIEVMGGLGTIDSDYRGEIRVLLINLSDTVYTIQPGERIAQMVFTNYVIPEWCEVEILDDTQRSNNGFGSTGKM